MEEISDRLKNLSPEEFRKLNRLSEENAYSREWCHMQGIDYVNPNFLEVMHRTYQEQLNIKDKC